MSPPDPSTTSLIATAHSVQSTDGTAINVWRIAGKTTATELRPALLLVHGGGFVTGGPRGSFNAASFWPKQLPENWLHNSDMICLYVEYRLSYNVSRPFISATHPFPKPFQDVYSTLLWANNNANMLGVDKKNITVMGFSAGGCLALATAVKARDQNLQPPIAKLVLVYPMLDPDTDWNNDDAHVNSWSEMFDKMKLRFGWNKYLNYWEGAEEKEYAKPLSMDLGGLPPTYLDVGTKDYFYSEVSKFKTLLTTAGVKLEYFEWDGMRHAFEQQKSQTAEHAHMVRDAQTRRLNMILGK